MSRIAVQGQRSDRRFPRVSGDEPPLATAVRQYGEFSPRERG